MEDTPPKPPGEVISFKKAARLIKKSRETAKTSTSLPGPRSGESDVEGMILTLVESMRTLHDHHRRLNSDHKQLSKRSVETVRDMSECMTTVVGMAQDMVKMALRVDMMEQEMKEISTQLTRALRANKRLRARLKKTQTTGG